MLLCDFYKISHRVQYPENTEMVYSTWTARQSRISGVNSVVWFGLQAFIKNYLIDFFDENFFSRPRHEVIAEYVRIIKHTLGVENPGTEHIEYLHGLGYLPLQIKALGEGTKVPIRVPMMTMRNLDPKCFWVTNYIESLMSCELWQPTTSATIADRYRTLLEHYANTTVGSTDFVPFQGHDFSMRGMSSLSSAMASGAGHLLSFVGTDTIPAISYLEQFYCANVEKELVGTSIPATEHSVQCAYGDDMAYFKRIINEIYPSGMVSIVSDGYDFWKVLTEVLPALKDDIMKRDGKVVIRPDSGDPIKILCGNPNGKTEIEKKGAVEVLWDIFGGTISEQGFKVLDSHIGAIYGDAITYTRCADICRRLKDKGFASVNVVYGIGSYTYQYNTRDTFGFALKSTMCQIDGKEIPIFKDPITDDGVKKSQRGGVRVTRDLHNHDKIVFEDQVSVFYDDKKSLLTTVFENGILRKISKLSEIRNRLRNQV